MTGRMRSNQESRSFKAKIKKLKKQGKPDAEIARELGVTRQYVSIVLIRAGLAGRSKRTGEVKVRETSPEAKATIDRLEQQGERGLAEKLRLVLEREPKVKKTGR